MSQGITNPAEPFFKDGQWGWDGTLWRKLPMVWGYSDRYFEDLGGTQENGGTYSAYGTEVPPGEVWVIQSMRLTNITGARGYINFYAYAGAASHVLYYRKTPAVGEYDFWEGAVALKAGDKVRVIQASCLDDDVLYGSVWGYKMKVAE